jgi:hypothetical protein
MRLPPDIEARARAETEQGQRDEFARREASLARVLRKARGGRPKKRRSAR